MIINLNDMDRHEHKVMVLDDLFEKYVDEYIGSKVYYNLRVLIFQEVFWSAEVIDDVINEVN